MSLFFSISVDFFTTNIIDIILGKFGFIGSKLSTDPFMNLRKVADKENQNNWVNALQMYYHYETLFVNKKHPKSKQVVKIINLSFEHGIIQRWDSLFADGIVMFYYVFEKIVEPQVLSDIKDAINYKRDHITFDELFTVFYFLIILLFISLVVFVIELLYFFYSYFSKTYSFRELIAELI